MSFRLRIPAPIFEAMIDQALAELPNECVGLLAGHADGLVVERYELVNALADPRRFESEPRSMFEAEKLRRQNGLEFLAIYHSHPAGSPVPSRRDVDCNYSDDVMNLIISLERPEQPEVRAWWLTAGSYRDAEWEVFEEPPGDAVLR
jgi:proteasome lid subunit RPN8/RPN11